MSLVDEIRRSWGWTGLNPVEVVGENDFGNLMIKDVNGTYWRLCPEDCYCELVASNRAELDALSTDQSFLRDWCMSDLVEYAQTKCGPLSEGRKYCLKIPGLLGGEYGGENIATAPLVEIIRMSGHIAQETKDLPDGSAVKLTVSDQ